MQISAHVNYHVKKAEPQAFEFDVDGIFGQLISPELMKTEVQVSDLRGGSEQPKFMSEGIEFINVSSSVQDFDLPDIKRAYEKELRAILSAKTGAQEVIVFDHTLRIDDPGASRRPARNVHNDYNAQGAEQRLLDLVGAQRAIKFHKRGYGFINVWRPIENVVMSAPLGFIRPRSMHPEDWIDIGLIYPERIGQILGVCANPNHEWFFKSKMRPDEAVIFNTYDNRGRPHFAHSALELLSDAAATTSRKSIESRTLVRF